ncbi:MAG TPA: hypothetical protein VIH93_12680 [Thermoanaerobaculia bacterium]|jgi:hypothetical protein
MSAPTLHRERKSSRDGESRAPAGDRLALLARCLAVPCPSLAAPLEAALARAAAAGAAPFEVVAGAPFTRYGSRLTFQPGADSARAADLGDAFGFAGHPWGAPAWVGLRVSPGGAVRAKAYHAAPRWDDLRSLLVRGLECPPQLPAGLPDGLRPVMAALDGEAAEIYLRRGPAGPWSAFAAAVLAAALPSLPPACREPSFAPHPRPAEDAFCLSLRWRLGALEALSLYADQRALPADGEVRGAWSAGLDEPDRLAYEAALAGVRSLARSPGPAGTRSWHAMLAWSLDREGGWHRAASLRVPVRG